jgi:hypothetical protein
MRIARHVPPGSDLIDLFWQDGVHVKAVIQYEFKLNRAGPTKYDISLTPLATGHLPSFQYFPNGEPSTGLVFELPNTPPNSGGFRTYLHEPVGTLLPDSDPAAIVDVGKRSLVNLVPLLSAFPGASCPFSGRGLYQVGIEKKMGEPMLCVDHL